MFPKALDFQLSHPNVVMERAIELKAVLSCVDDRILFKWVNTLVDPTSPENSHQLHIIAY